MEPSARPQAPQAPRGPVAARRGQGTATAPVWPGTGLRGTGTACGLQHSAAMSQSPRQFNHRHWRGCRTVKDEAGRGAAGASGGTLPFRECQCPAHRDRAKKDQGQVSPSVLSSREGDEGCGREGGSSRALTRGSSGAELRRGAGSLQRNCAHGGGLKWGSNCAGRAATGQGHILLQALMPRGTPKQAAGFWPRRAQAGKLTEQVYTTG